MNTQQYVNPPSALSRRTFVPPGSPRFNDMIAKLIQEFNKANQMHYCPQCHSIETRHTMRTETHRNCTHATKSEIIGESIEETKRKFLDLCTVPGHVDQNGLVRDLFFAVEESQMSKVKNAKNSDPLL